MYCGAELMDAAEIVRRTIAALFPARERDRTGHLVAVLPGQDADRLAEGAASVFGCDPYMAAQLLRRPFPPVEGFDIAPHAAAYAESLQGAGVRFVSFAEAVLNEVLEPAPLHHIRIDGDTLELSADGATTVCRIADLAYIVLGKVEVHRNKRVREVKANGIVEIETTTTVEAPDFKALTIFDLYGALPRPARAVETVCTIEGAGFDGSSRGGNFSRFGRWLQEQNTDLPLDDRYRQLGQSDRRGDSVEGGRVHMHQPSHSREVLGTHTLYSGQGFDEFSVIAWTIWRLAQGTTAWG